jgi:hypothetical protein
MPQDIYDARLIFADGTQQAGTGPGVTSAVRRALQHCTRPVVPLQAIVAVYVAGDLQCVGRLPDFVKT